MPPHRFNHGKRQASSTARGYDAAHKAERERRRHHHHPANPCAHCGQPCGPWSRRLHLPHNATRTGYLPGMAHDVCNIRDGAIRGNQVQALKHPHLRRKPKRITPLSL